MLSAFFKSLLFPQLKFQKRITMSNSQSLPMYKLDWTKMEEICQQRHEDWNKDYWPKHDLKLNLPLPEKYLTICDNLLFVLPAKYHNEITRNASMAVLEWSQHRSFDTCIREHCLLPAKSFVEIAFYLLNDCVYDEATVYYVRDRTYYLNMMLYRFWRYQTGRGMLFHRAKLDELENRDDESTQDFVIEMMKFQKLIDETEGAPAIEPAEGKMAENKEKDLLD